MIELELDKQYETYSGKIVTIVEDRNERGLLRFRGSNGYFYTSEGAIYTDGSLSFDGVEIKREIE